MDCRQCSDELTAYIDGELAESAAQQIRDHLRECGPCREQHKEIVNSEAFVVEHAVQLEPVPEIWNNLRARIAELPPPTESGGFSRFLALNRWPAMFATIAATLVLAFGLWGYYQHQQSARGLEAYMNEYIQTRTAQENQRNQQMVQTQDTAGQDEASSELILGNPFAEIRPAVFVNPFRGEDK